MQKTMKKRVDKSGAEVLEQLQRAGAEAEWTDAELDEALGENGIDPAHFVRNVLSHVTRLVKETPAREPLPVLGVWREKTSLKPRAIAEALGVTVAFVSDVNRHVKELPRRWVLALARRAEERLGVPFDVTLSAFDNPFQFARAASRDAAYEQSCPTCEELLRRSGMDAAEQRFWLDLLAEGDA